MVAYIVSEGGGGGRLSMEKLESGQLLICSTHQTSAGSQLPVGVVPAIPKAEVNR